jgi:hypothetical protein
MESTGADTDPASTGLWDFVIAPATALLGTATVDTRLLNFGGALEATLGTVFREPRKGLGEFGVEAREGIEELEMESGEGLREPRKGLGELGMGFGELAFNPTREETRAAAEIFLPAICISSSSSSSSSEVGTSSDELSCELESKPALASSMATGDAEGGAATNADLVAAGAALTSGVAVVVAVVASLFVLTVEAGVAAVVAVVTAVA